MLASGVAGGRREGAEGQLPPFEMEWQLFTFKSKNLLQTMGFNGTFF